MVTLQTVEQVERILQELAAGPQGLTLPQLRRHYPAKEVRRTTIMAALHHLEAHGLVEWHGDHVHWSGPIRGDVRPYGVDRRSLARDLALAPQERVQQMVELSNALARTR